MQDFTEHELQAMQTYKQAFIEDLNNQDIVEVLGLTKAKRHGYICPVCRSGEGHNGTGAEVTKDRRHITCYAGQCFGPRGEDVLGALHITTGLSQDAILKSRYPAYDIRQALRRPEPQYISAAFQSRPAPAPVKEEAAQPAADYTAYYELCRSRLDTPEAVAYLNGRGISLETAQRCDIGFDPQADPASAPGAMDDVGKLHPAPRIIIPTCRSFYVARSIDPNAMRFINPKGGSPHLFNGAALTEAGQKVVFITEGWADALSFLEVGAAAVALNSTANAELVIEAMQHSASRPVLVLCLDNDAAGQRAAEQLNQELRKKTFPSITAHFENKYKDINEYLRSDCSSFREFVEEYQAQAAHIEELQQDELREICAASHIQDFVDGIAASASTPPISTGFHELNMLLEGGLYPGLYILGAISSLGKTSFLLQVADQIAAGGHDVLYFSLEMARSELMAKSISRHTYLDSIERTGDKHLAKTTRGILNGARYGFYGRDEVETIKRAVTAYGEYAEHLYIQEAIGDIGVAQIRETVERFIAKKSRPVVFIDYLQILAPYDPRCSDKQNTDRAVLELKRISRDYNLPILCISSFNRESYTAPVNMTAFKESGAIEYGSDTLLGLQYVGMDRQEGETEKGRDNRVFQLMRDMQEVGKAGNAQPVEIKILKQRNGSKGSTEISFYPMFNYYCED